MNWALVNPIDQSVIDKFKDKMMQTAYEDGIVTIDEYNIIERAMKHYNKFLADYHQAQLQGNIDEDQAKQLMKMLDKLQSAAMNEALKDSVLTKDEYQLLVTIAKTVDEVSKSFNSTRAPVAVGPYPHAKRVGNLLFLSGIGPRKKGMDTIPGVELDAENNIISYDIAIQCKAVFDNIRFILEDAGSSWDQIVDVTTFLTNMEADFATYNKLYAEYFGSVQPTRTTVGVSRLPTPIAIELKVIATIA